MRPWLESVINSPYCKLHCFEQSSFLTGDSDYGQNRVSENLSLIPSLYIPWLIYSYFWISNEHPLF